MKKEELVKLGLDAETAEKVAAASNEELKTYIPKARFDEVNNAKIHAENTVKERDKQIEELKAASGDAESLKKQIETLRATNKQKDSEHAAEIKKLKVDAAVDTALTVAKAKNLKAARALLDLDKAELSDDGTVKGLTEQIEKLKTGDDTKFLFDSSAKPKMKGAKTGEEGVEEGDKKPDFSKMSYDELCAYLADNPDTNLD